MPIAPPAANRFHFGLPASLTAKALRLGLGGYSLDAACASSLYAIRQASERLHDRDADLMVAGGVNGSDSLFLHAGFTALGALSPTGQSLPFQRNADGLIPSEGAAFVVLKRLDDAIVAGDKIACIIRGIGLSNDGRSKGLLMPSSEGQIRAMHSALELADLAPEQISYVECHATGTPVGDDTEIHSMSAVYGNCDGLAIGSLKSNLGHLMTAAGAAGLIKVIAAMKAGMLPGMRNTGNPSAAMQSSHFRSFNEPVPWITSGPKRAAVSAFGFGGNNAHLIVEEWVGKEPAETRIYNKYPPATVAITGIGVIAANKTGTEEFLRTLALGESCVTISEQGISEQRVPRAQAEQIQLAPSAIKFPPSDLRDCESQQLSILQAALEATANIKGMAASRSGVFIGMESSAEIARHCAAWRIAYALEEREGALSADWMDKLAQVLPPLSRSATVVGTMPNMPANRLNSQFDLRGLGFTVAAGELSGAVALSLAMRALRSGEIDLAIVGAVDFSCEPVHESAKAGASGDAAVVLVLQRLDQIDERDIFSVIDNRHTFSPTQIFERNSGDADLSHLFGLSYAASGLLDIAAAALCVRHGLRLSGKGRRASFLLPINGVRCAQAGVNGSRIQLTSTALATYLFEPAPQLFSFFGNSREQVLNAIRNRQQSATGSTRLVVVATGDAELQERLSFAEKALVRSDVIRNVTLAEGIYYSETDVGGEIGFVFTGAAAAYPGMGKELLLARPELSEHLAHWNQHLESRAAWIYEEQDLSRVTTEQYLHGASFLCQLHAKLTLDVFKLRPAAALGLSSGESNALFAFGAWNDPDCMFRDITESGLYDRELGGSFNAVKAAWHLDPGATVKWVCWRVSAPVDKIKSALESEPQVSVMIIHHEGDCLIGGDSQACARLLKTLGSPPAQQTTHNLAIHCAEVRSFAGQWWDIHHRRTSPVPGVRFYANAIGDWYVPDDQLAADMLTRQAVETVDFPKTVRKAWEDGVRIFVEHGPRNLCSEWIGYILGDRPHVTVVLDRFGKSSALQAAYAAAQLIAAGVDVQGTNVAIKANKTATEPSREFLTFPAHPPPVVIPPLHPPEQLMQTMVPAPLLPDAEPETSFASPMRIAPLTSADQPGSAILALRGQGEAFRGALAQHVEILRLTLQARLTFANTPRPGRAKQTVVQPLMAAQSSTASSLKTQFNREQILVHATGKISGIFGDLFQQQDVYRRQVRMPADPMLLVDRVTNISGEAGSMSQGTIWTETDIREDSWFLHERRIPAGLLIEAGQADLMLVSWLGADLENRDERVYRLLGCDLTYHGNLPKVGDTLQYEIHIDRYAQQGPVKIFFFHYSCKVGDDLCLTVLNGQAGFFSDEELNKTAGVLWDASTAAYNRDAFVATPLIQPRSSFSQEQVNLFSEGRTWECFGQGYEYAGPHKLSPRIPSGLLLLLGEITDLAPAGGPWKRGYMRSVKRLSPADWFFEGHFKNDPCMPVRLWRKVANKRSVFIWPR